MLNNRTKPEVERYKIILIPFEDKYAVLKSNGDGGFHPKGSTYNERGIKNRVITIVREEHSSLIIDNFVPEKMRSQLEEIISKYHN